MWNFPLENTAIESSYIYFIAIIDVYLYNRWIILLMCR